MKKSFIAFILSVTILVIFSGSYWLYETKVFVSESRASSNTISSENSYCFTSPICVSADGKQNQRITIFCLNNRGTGISGLSSQLSTDPDIIFRTIQGKSDTEGKVVFDVTSNTKKDVKLNAFCGGLQINCQPQICFN